MIFVVTVEYSMFNSDFRSGLRSVTVIGKNDALHYAKDCMRAINAQSVMITDAYTGEIVYENKYGEEWFGV